MHIVIAALCLAVATMLLQGKCALAQEQEGSERQVAQLSRSAPEAGSGTSRKALARARRYMVSAANPHAVRAGLEMLRAGGSAVDAAIATQLVLNLVEPQSSGIGGGAFILHWHAGDKKLVTYDGREQAPAAAQPGRFLQDDGSPRRLRDAIFGGLSIGVPGLVRVMALAHDRHGKLPWAKLFEPAIRLSKRGFAVSRRLNLLLRWIGAAGFSPAARAYFFDADDSARPTGHLLRNPEFAETLQRIAEGGPNAFYSGPIAQAVVRAATTAQRHQSDMTLADLANYQPRVRTPVCVTYRRHRVCGMGPPSSGGLTVAMVLKLIEPFDLGAQPLNTQAMHLIAEAEKLAYADRARYMADDDFVPVPMGLIDARYLDVRRRLIDPKRAGPRRKPGRPPGLKRTYGHDFSQESSGTSHISIVDGEGNAVSMTTTIESAFGSRQWAAGFLLNNELTDFSFRQIDRQGRRVANAVAAGKRPRSSMAPTIVFGPDGRLQAVLGSPGGTRIILYVIKTLVGLIDWKLDAQAAAALTNFGARRSAFEVEQSLGAPMLGLRMKARGHTIRAGLMVSGTHVVVRRPDGVLEGGADPRREGIALGD